MFAREHAGAMGSILNWAAQSLEQLDQRVGSYAPRVNGVHLSRILSENALRIAMTEYCEPSSLNLRVCNEPACVLCVQLDFCPIGLLEHPEKSP